MDGIAKSFSDLTIATSLVQRHVTVQYRTVFELTWSFHLHDET